MSIFGMDKTGSFRVIDSFGMKYTVNVYQKRLYASGLECKYEYGREKRVLTTGESLRRIGNGVYKIVGKDIILKNLDICVEV